jgi:orotate phosphoribosyltransferase
MNSEVASKIAHYLLEAKAVKLNPANPFTWASGWKSPIYCDNRVTLSYPHIRSFIKQSLAQGIREHFKDAEILVGVATAGIAIGALAADELNLPYAYARPKPKEHGLKNQIEGKIEPGQKIVVIEDLISTGGSSLKVVDYLRENGHQVLGMAAIFTYGFKVADQAFTNSDCPIFTLSNYSALIEEALKSGYVSESELSSLSAWRENPGTWTGL